jgi:hydrogenase nickel incorporation protein HypA/HybF
MHEMGIALQIIEIASSSIPEQYDDVQVETVNVRVGKLTAVIPESLRFCFNVASRDTRLAGARLEIAEVPIQAECQDCKNSLTIEGLPFVCDKCGSGHLEILTGRELVVASIQVADPQGE